MARWGGPFPGGCCTSPPPPSATLRGSLPGGQAHRESAPAAAVAVAAAMVVVVVSVPPQQWQGHQLPQGKRRQQHQCCGRGRRAARGVRALLCLPRRVWRPMHVPRRLHLACLLRSCSSRQAEGAVWGHNFGPKEIGVAAGSWWGQGLCCRGQGVHLARRLQLCSSRLAESAAGGGGGVGNLSEEAEGAAERGRGQCSCFRRL